MKFTRHPLSALFSAYDLAGDELKALAISIRDQGQMHPITLWQGSILDGFNRYQACAVYGIEPITVELPESQDAWEFVKAQNMTRRHMTPTERGAVLAMKAQLSDGCTKMYTPSVSEIQADIDVSRGTANKISRVIKAADPQINQALSDGRISLDRAAKVATLPQADRQAAIDTKPEPHRTPEKAEESESESDALEEANDRAHDLAIELEAYMLAAGENGEAAKEIIRLNGMIETLKLNRDEWQNKCAELTKQVRSEQAKVKKLEAKVKALESASTGGF